MLTEADHLCIIFRVGGLGFVMPVADLMAIRDPADPVADVIAGCQSPCQLGSIEFQGIEIPVFDLVALLRLSTSLLSQEKRYLVFTGAEYPWAIVVDRVDGVYEKAVFDYQELPLHLFDSMETPYRSVAIHKGEPLVNFDPVVLGRQLVGSL